MNPLSLQPSGRGRSSRHKVRIVKRRRISRTAILSAVLGLLAAVSLPLLWFIGRPPPKREIPEMDSRDWVWKCDAGHTFRAGFRNATSLCFRCDKPAYPIGWYTCPVHGSFEVAGKFERGADGKMSVTKVRLIGRSWVTQEELECPRCDRRLLYKGRDPLERTRRMKKQGGE